MQTMSRPTSAESNYANAASAPYDTIAANDANVAPAATDTPAPSPYDTIAAAVPELPMQTMPRPTSAESNDANTTPAATDVQTNYAFTAELPMQTIPRRMTNNI